MKKLVCLFLATVTSGCNLPYKAPETSNLAKVRFFAPEAVGVGIYAHKDDNCGGAEKLRVLGGNQGFGEMSSKETDIGMWKTPGTKYDRNLYVEILVAAGERSNFTIGGQCRLTVSFLPKTNGQYEVNYFWAGGRCNVTIGEIIREGDEIRLVNDPSGKKNEKACSWFWN